MVITKATRSDSVTKREKRNRQLSREAAAEGIVLLENNGVLPLKPQPVALFGVGAEFTIPGGSGSGEVKVRHEVNVREGLENAGFQVTSEDWLCRCRTEWKDGKEAFLQAVRKKVKLNVRSLEALMGEEYRYPAGPYVSEQDGGGAEVCLYVISRQSGEGYDRKDEAGSFRLEEREVKNIWFCAAHFSSFVLVLNVGAPIDLSPLDDIDGIDAVLYMGQIGMEGGNALADVLTGKVSPSGKLALTWPKRYADVPYDAEFSSAEDAVPYKEGIFVGYRYYDTFQVEPRYPFGYGKSYTTFRVDVKQAERTGHKISCTVAITNTGSCEGKEVLQIYAEGPFAEKQRLLTFAKSPLLSPGMYMQLELSFSIDALSVYDEASAQTWINAGAYLLHLGTSSRHAAPAAVIDVKEDILISVHKNLCAAAHPVTELVPPDRKDAALQDTDGLPHLAVSSNVWLPRFFRYHKPKENLSAKTKKLLEQLSKKDQIRLCAGTGIFGEKKGFSVPGAAGHTTTAFLERGIPNVELCDGPAGLRLQKRSTQQKNGSIKPVDPPISVYEYLPKWIRKRLLGNPKKDPVLYQFVTGFPAAAMVAQTWNLELTYQIGRAVSEEMHEYGVRIWLAPALNIVRNPLCGRNYEYFSEDPRLSGKLAAAITRGVQEWPGNCVTLKHFAANNKEEGRFTSSSDVDERVLREIYLKGFEIAVREGTPKCIMTAYNKINGVYCANSHALCTDILRNEWGFDGVVMTDWFAAIPGRAEEGRAIEAGVDLIMPGGKQTIKNLEKQIQEDAAKTALRRAAGRMLQLLLQTKNEE